ncbi:uncharacterized protein LOC135577015 [Columba livia]|uniref:uncharacterized protein LOC135577015 n=1 Tax=Columba livia TaxID=8932 RepID=UPI0031BBA244
MTCSAVENSSGNDSKTDLLCLDVAPSEEGVPIRPSAPVLPVDSDDESSDEKEAIAGVKGITVTPISHRTRNREKEKEAQKGGGLSNVIAPLRQAVGVGGEPVYVKVPFSPGDLVIWKQSAGPYRENPDKVAKVIKMIIKTQNPDWDDLQVILDTLMDSTEKDMVIRAARDKVREDIRNGRVEGNVDENFPKEDPRWNYNTGGGLCRLRRYQDWLFIGVQTAMPKQMNWSKLYNVRQEKNESPSAFLERLKEAAKRYTDLDIETEQAKTQLALIFLGQSQDDIRKKLQKLEGAQLKDLDGAVGHRATTIVGATGKEEAIEDAVIPTVWETNIPGKSKAAKPVKVVLKEGAEPVRLRQYPLKLEARLGIVSLIEKFLKYGILEECESEYNTPIFPVKKPDGSYRLVQDLRAINQITKDIHPVVANPYTLLTSVKEKYKWFTVLDLKDAFFCIPLNQESKKLFAFKWENPHNGRKAQLTWTRLPQGFKNSPTIFGNQLAKELEEWTTRGHIGIPRQWYLLLQYVDDILIAAETQELCIQVTIEILNQLGTNGYKVSKIKLRLHPQL